MSLPTNAQTEAMHIVKPKLGLMAVVMIIYFTVAGGAYGLEGVVSSAGPGMALVLVLVTPFIWSIPTVLMVLELSTAMPVQGGYYAWVKRALGPFWGFVEGWTSWLYGIVITASFAVLFTDYLSTFLGMIFNFTLLDTSKLAHWLVAAAFTAFFSWINIRGAKSVGDSTRLFLVLVLAPFVVMALFALVKYLNNPAAFYLPVTPPGTTPASAFSLGLFVVMYNYLGWDGVSTVLDEIDEPLKTMPKAMAISIVLVILAYLIPVVSGLISGYDWTKWEAGTWPNIAEALGGKWLGAWSAFGGLFSAAGLFTALLLSASRLPFVLAADHYLPPIITKLHPKYGTPYVAILVCSVLFLVLETGTFDNLLTITVILYAVALLLEFAALIALRIKEPNMRRPFKVPGGLFGAIFIAIPPAVILFMATRGTYLDIYNDKEQGPQAALNFLLMAGGVLATGPIAYLITKAFVKRGRPDVEVPIHYDHPAS